MKRKKILNGILIAMSCLLATGIVLSVTNVFDIETKEETKEEAKDEVSDTSSELPSDEVKTWNGTAVPIDYKGRIYTNDNLNGKELKAILDTIDFVTHEDLGTFYLVYGTEIINSDDSRYYYGLGIQKLQDGYLIMWGSLENPNFIGGYAEDNILFPSFNGLSCTSLSTLNGNETEEFAELIGQTMQNDKLKDVFSITPFE